MFTLKHERFNFPFPLVKRLNSTVRMHNDLINKLVSCIIHYIQNKIKLINQQYYMGIIQMVN